jgi:hypothetical protein
MNLRTAPHRTATILIWTTLLYAAKSLGQAQAPAAPKFTIPKTWDDEAMPTLEIPLADAIGSPKHVSADYYYRIPVRPIYKQYPVYAPGREPAGYMDWLKKQEPVLLWNDTDRKPELKTEADWIKAGEIVFSAPPFSDGGGLGVVALADIQSSAWYEKSGMPIARDGVLPFVHYVIRQKGKIELGTFSCAMCHTRVMPSGTVIKGAQGNFPFERSAKYSPRPLLPAPLLRAFSQSPLLRPLAPSRSYGAGKRYVF